MDENKFTIGFIDQGDEMGDPLVFFEEAKNRGHKLIYFDTGEEFNENDLRKKAAKCNIIYNNACTEHSLEIAKTLEFLGKKVIEPTRTLYYTEDKWLTNLKCKQHNIPHPKTILLSRNFYKSRKQLKKFGKWPIILKRVEGWGGKYVEKAKNLGEAEEIIRKFWKKGGSKIPIIAQEFIKSKSYRVTIINGKVFQTAIKVTNGWKSTGIYQKKASLRFKISKPLEKIIKRVYRYTNLTVFGIDLMKKGRKWVLLEVNCQPCLNFFPEDKHMLVREIFNALELEANYKK